jgi:NADPH-dependent glutamate synthase beta subunit-like oxidoreductase/ferredoxin
MAEQRTCPVSKTLGELSRLVATDRITDPRARRQGEELIELMADLSGGQAGPDHLSVMEQLAELLMKGEDAGGIDLGMIAAEALTGEREVFASHMETRNCPTGDCDLLTPAPCQMACPAGIDVASYVSLIGQGRDAEAIELIRRDNPFPWVCGLVCTHPCEFACVRGRVDRAIAIKELKAFAAERAMSTGRYVNPEKAPDNGHKVCVIGAGPAGLTAAYYLALRGYGVTVIEELPEAGGMMRVGIPRYRLPAAVIDWEVTMIRALGVEFRFHTRVGRDVTFEDLRNEGFGAFFLAVGAHGSHKLGVKGEDDYPQVLDAVKYLLRVALGDRQAPGRRVAVIGGGNVAIDAARTSVRLGCEEVLLLYRRSRAEMPANREEVEQALEEGIRFSYLTIPVEVLGAAGRLTGLRCLRAELSEPDESGRRKPVPVDGSDHVVALDAIITAIGQKVEGGGLESLAKLRWTRRNAILADTISGGTGEVGVFAGGDAVLGPATVVEAIGAGKSAAAGIDRYLRGLPQPRMPWVPSRRARVDSLEVPASTKMTLQRPVMPMLDADRRRTTFQQVELGLCEIAAREEARRCLRCDVCKRCGTCISICREKMGIDALQLGYLKADQPGVSDFRITAERCILCGACAANCPTGAIVLRERDDKKMLNLCGTVLYQGRLDHCEVCGAAIGAARFLNFVSSRTESIGRAFQGRILCGDCGRRAAAASASSLTVPAAT